MTPLHDVSVGTFQGPLDLLLELIEQEKMDVTQLALAHVTDQYLERMRQMEDLPPEHLAQFLSVASRLILLKSKRLLPQFVLSDEEEESILSLEQQLKEYQRFRKQAKLLREQWLKPVHLQEREAFLGVSITYYPPSNFTSENLFLGIQAVLKGLPTLMHSREEAMARVVSLEERIQDIQARIQHALATSFHGDVINKATRADVIVSFLALLELVKQRIVHVEQTASFQDILIRKRTS